MGRSGLTQRPSFIAPKVKRGVLKEGLWAFTFNLPAACRREMAAPLCAAQVVRVAPLQVYGPRSQRRARQGKTQWLLRRAKHHFRAMD